MGQSTGLTVRRTLPVYTGEQTSSDRPGWFISEMDGSDWTPSIVSNDSDQIAYIVVDDFGPIGRSYRDTGADRADLEAIIMGMLEGRYSSPVRVVGFNTAEGWSKDVSAGVAYEVRYRCDLQMRDVPYYLEEFVEQHEGGYRDVQLPLPIRLG